MDNRPVVGKHAQLRAVNSSLSPGCDLVLFPLREKAESSCRKSAWKEIGECVVWHEVRLRVSRQMTMRRVFFFTSIFSCTFPFHCCPSFTFAGWEEWPFDPIFTAIVLSFVFASSLFQHRRDRDMQLASRKKTSKNGRVAHMFEKCKLCVPVFPFCLPLCVPTLRPR